MAQLVKTSLASNAHLLRLATEDHIRKTFPTLHDVDFQIHVSRSLANLCLLLADESPHTRNDYRQVLADTIDGRRPVEVPAP